MTFGKFSYWYSVPQNRHFLVMVMAFTLFAACDDPNDPNKGDESTGGEGIAVDVNGKTFLYDHVEVNSEETKEIIESSGMTVEEYIAQVDDIFKSAGVWIKFVDGSIATSENLIIGAGGSYTQEGVDVKIDGDIYCKAIDGKFIMRTPIFSLGGSDGYIDFVFVLVDEEMTPGGEGVAVDVDGKTFVYDSFDIEFSDEAKKEAEEMGMDLDKFTDYMMKESGIEEAYSSMEISFKDGKVTTTIEGVATPAVDYEQDGKNITIDGMTAEEYGALTVSGSKLVMEYTEEGMGTVKITFKQK